jgi:ElaB/YqjD/DUF883 family membrane-anchored ribosome-binding protein
MMTTELFSPPGTLEGKKDMLVKDLKAVVGDADELLKEVMNSTSQGFAVARTRLEGKLGEASVRLGEMRQAVGETARGAANASQEYVAEHPWKVLALLAGAGLIIGALFSRR